jgi:hypothetical protein
MDRVKIVAGTFDDEPHATAAAGSLRHAGFEPADIDQFVVNPAGRHHALPLGGDVPADPHSKGGEKAALSGAAIGGVVGAVAGVAATPLVGPAAIAGGLAAGAYAGALAGAVKEMGASDKPKDPERPAGVLVAVRADTPEDREVAIDLLRSGGAKLLEECDGEWRNGKWTDFDPVAKPHALAHAMNP